MSLKQRIHTLLLPAAPAVSIFWSRIWAESLVPLQPMPGFSGDVATSNVSPLKSVICWRGALRPEDGDSESDTEQERPATPEEKSLSKKFMKYWANFARTGNPNSPDLTTWPQYGAGEHYMEMNLNLKSSSKLKERKYKFWTRILPEKIQSQKATGDDRADL